MGLVFVECCFERDEVAGLLRISWCVSGGADVSIFFFLIRFSFERTRPASRMRPPLASLTSLLVRGKAEGAKRRSLFFTLGSLEAGEYRLTRRTCFLSCRFELDAVAGLLWISWCVSGGAHFSVCIFFRISFLRTQTACCRYES